MRALSLRPSPASGPRVEHVLGRHPLGPYPALGERHVLRDAGVEVVADHEHVEVLGQRVDGVRPSGVGRGGQHIGVGGDADDVWRVAAAGALVWKVWMVRPAIAATVSSTKPASFRVSVWMATWTSYSSATAWLQSMTAGVVPSPRGP